MHASARLPGPPGGADYGTGLACSEQEKGAFYRALFDQVAENYPLGDRALPLLAVRRARPIHEFLVQEGGIAPRRLQSGAIRAVEERDGAISAGLDLSVRGGA